MFWVIFHLFVFAMLWLDYHLKGGIGWRVLLWIVLALGFNGLVGWMQGADAALTFFTAYVIESSLSLDNLFVFLLVFTVLQIEKEYQHRVLLLGILGAFFFRILFILLGITLLQSFSWMYPVLGAILCFTAILAWKSGEVKLQDTFVFRGLKKVVHVEEGEHKGQFWIKKKGRWHATRLLFALLLIELFDLVFAIDSIPAVLSITQDPFLAYTSNVFAVLGLRSFYLALSRWQEKMPDIKSAISCILLFVGAKMVSSPWIHIPNGISLTVVVVILVSFFFFAKKKKPV